MTRPHQRDGEKRRREYLLVTDLANRVQCFRAAGLKVPDQDHDFFSETCEVLAELVQECLLGPVVRVINMQDLSYAILSRAHEIAGGFDSAYIVSSCTEIASPAHGTTLEINRLVDYQGNILGIGPRPGYPSIESQILSIMATAGDRPIIVMEDGVFSGRTLCDVVHRLGKNVTAIVVGFVFPEGRDILCKEFDEKQLHIIESVNDPADWVPDHDFFPFIPNCGRVLGAMMNGKAYPFYDYDGFPFAIPYLMPFSPMKEWTGLEVVAKMAELSRYCLYRTIELFRLIGEMNGRLIRPSDLRGCKPRICLPFQVGRGTLPSIRDESICDFLYRFDLEKE